MKKVFLLMFLTGIFFTSCHHLDDVTHPVISNCDKDAIEDATRFSQISTANYHVDNVVLNGDCLEVTITSSACLPEHLEMDLIGTVSLATVYPPLVMAKIELTIHSLCTVIQQKTVSFDITPLQISGANQIQISVDGWNNPIIYNY